ncbi:hypothetical protein ACLB2K_032328 [Fragaria x ananassa]
MHHSLQVLAFPDQSSSFIDTHLRNQNYLPYSPSLFASCDQFYYRDQHYLLLWNNKALRFLDWYNITRAFDKLELLHPREAEYYDVYDCKKKKVHWFDVVGTCNGILLLCLTGFRFDKYRRLRADVREAIMAILWNPSIRRFVIIPSPSVSFKKGFFVDYAFGYDSSTNDYKILRSVVHDSYEIPTEVEVWSLARGSWKTLIPDIIPSNFNPMEPYRGQHVFVNGALHWVQFCNIDWHKYIVLFSMPSESFGEITMPEVLRNDSHDCYMSRYCESSLALLIEDFHNNNNLHLWVMKEYGVAESWTKLFTVGSVYTRAYSKQYYFRKNGELLVNFYDGLWGSWWSFNYEIEKWIEFDGFFDDNFMDSFIESIAAILHLLGSLRAQKFMYQ